MNKPLSLLAAAAILAAGCSGKPAAKPTAETAAMADSFPLPQIPAAIVEPQQRAAYAAARFWDSALLPDSATASLEQAMANFASMTALLADSSARDSVATAMLARPACPAQLDAMLEVAEHYFFDPNSPMRDEEMFIAILQAAPADERRSALLARLLKNRVGTRAASFVFTTAAGKPSDLAAEAARAPLSLLYFFDTECPTCKSLIPVVESHAAELGARVIAIAPQANAGSMADVAPLFPASWTVGADRGDIDNRELYFFPALPSLYLVDSALTVLAKDIPI